MSLILSRYEDEAKILAFLAPDADGSVERLFNGKHYPNGKQQILVESITVSPGTVLNYSSQHAPAALTSLSGVSLSVLGLI